MMQYCKYEGLLGRECGVDPRGVGTDDLYGQIFKSKGNLPSTGDLILSDFTV